MLKEHGPRDSGIQSNPESAADRTNRRGNRPDAQDLERLPSDVRSIGDQVKQDAKSIQAGQGPRRRVPAQQAERPVPQRRGPHALLAQPRASRAPAGIAGVDRLEPKCIPHRRQWTQPERLRGRTVPFDDSHPAPQVLFEHLAVDGDFRDGGQTVPFAGTISNVTTQPAVHGRPATVDIQTARPHAVSHSRRSGSDRDDAPRSTRRGIAQPWTFRRGNWAVRRKLPFPWPRGERPSSWRSTCATTR